MGHSRRQFDAKSGSLQTSPRVRPAHSGGQAQLRIGANFFPNLFQLDCTKQFWKFPLSCTRSVANYIVVCWRPRRYLIRPDLIVRLLWRQQRGYITPELVKPSTPSPSLGPMGYPACFGSLGLVSISPNGTTLYQICASRAQRVRRW